jgi:drug/metabolite transporter (DMT)-like permease
MLVNYHVLAVLMGMNSFLYVSVVFIWGTTWVALLGQVGDVPIVLSVFYRFALASILFLPALYVLGKLQRVQSIDHFFFLLQGLCLFSINYLFFYNASLYLVSGLISVIFALATLFNAFNQWLIWRRPPPATIYLSSVLGVVGLMMLFWGQFFQGQYNSESLLGIAYAALGTYCFSLGNMISLRHSACGIQPSTSIAYSMIYGAVILLIIVLFSGVEWVWDSRPIYGGTLLYLAIPGSILAFTAYLSLIGRIGADKAVYSTVLFPIVALTISTFVENYAWDIFAVAGLVFILLGVLLALKGAYLKRYFLKITAS